MSLLKQSTGRNITILMVDAADHLTGKPSLTLTITASKDGAAFASITPTVTDLGSGWYTLALTTTHTNTLGDLALHVTGTGADPSDSKHEVLLDLPGASVASVTGAVGSVSGNVGGSVASVTTVSDKTGYRLSATGVDDVWDEATAGHVTAGTTGKALTDAGSGGTPPTAVAIADAVMTRASSNWEATAPVKSLGMAVMKACHRVRDNAGTLEVYRADGTTLHASQAVTGDATNLPIDELGGAA